MAKVTPGSRHYFMKPGQRWINISRTVCTCERASLKAIIPACREMACSDPATLQRSAGYGGKSVAAFWDRFFRQRSNTWMNKSTLLESLSNNGDGSTASINQLWEEITVEPSNEGKTQHSELLRSPNSAYHPVR